LCGGTCLPLIPALGRKNQADLRVPGQPGLESGFQGSQGYTETLYLEKTKTNQANKHKQKKKTTTKNPTFLFQNQA
jgi:hypothetical protein